MSSPMQYRVRVKSPHVRLTRSARQCPPTSNKTATPSSNFKRAHKACLRSLRDRVGLLIGIAANVVLAFASPVHAAEWTNFRMHKVGFAMEVPTIPQRSVSLHQSFLGDISNHRFAAEEGDAVFTAEVSVLPPVVTALAGQGTILGKAVQTFLDDTGARCMSSTDIHYLGVSGKQLTYELPPVHNHRPRAGRAHFFLIERQLYIFYAEAPQTEVWASAERFLSSVRFE